MRYLASTSFGGSKALAKTDLSPLAGRIVVKWPDHDEPGQAYAAKLAEELVTLHRATPLILPITDALIQAQDSVSLIPIPIRRGCDVADSIAAGWGRGEIDALIDSVAYDLPDATAAYLTNKVQPSANDTHPPM